MSTRLSPPLNSLIKQSYRYLFYQIVLCLSYGPALHSTRIDEQDQNATIGNQTGNCCSLMSTRLSPSLNSQIKQSSRYLFYQLVLCLSQGLALHSTRIDEHDQNATIGNQTDTALPARIPVCVFISSIL